MFVVLLIVALIAAVLLGALILSRWNRESALNRVMATGAAVGIVGVLVIAAFATSQGRMYLQKLWTSTRHSYWLILDESGGRTMRVWLYYGYVQSADQSDGWQFRDGRWEGMQYVSGDASLKQIRAGLFNAFLQTSWRREYNVPENAHVILVSVHSDGRMPCADVELLRRVNERCCHADVEEAEGKQGVGYVPNRGTVPHEKPFQRDSEQFQGR